MICSNKLAYELTAYKKAEKLGLQAILACIAAINQNRISGKKDQIVGHARVDRNGPCSCESGVKAKKCCFAVK